MRVSITPDHDFNRALFASLCEKAKGTDTQQAFALRSQLSLNFINKCLRQKLPANPAPSSIKRIADASKGRVSYSELLDAAGYDPKRFDDIISEELIDDQEIFNSVLSTIQKIQSSYYERGMNPEIRIGKVKVGTPMFQVAGISRKTPDNSVNIFTLNFEDDVPNGASDMSFPVIQWSFYLFPGNERSRDYYENILNLIEYISREHFNKDGQFMLSILTTSDQVAGKLRTRLGAFKFWTEVVIINPSEQALENIMEKRLRLSFPDRIGEQLYTPVAGEEYKPLTPYSIMSVPEDVGYSDKMKSRLRQDNL